MFSHLAPKERMAFGALALLFLGFAGYVGSRAAKPHPAIQIYESKPKQESRKPQPASTVPTAPSPNSGPSGSIEPLSPAQISVSPMPDTSPTPPPTTDEIMVHVAGAVVKPGIYKFRSGARIADAIQAAKGFRKDADQDQLNLAAKLVDGTQVYAPKKSSVVAAPTIEPAYSPGATVSSAPSSGTEASDSRPSRSGKKSFSGVLNLNTATSDQLQQIPGIGPATAQHILTYRTEHGRFNSIEELLNVGGIGEKKLAKMRPYFRL